MSVKYIFTLFNF